MSVQEANAFKLDGMEQLDKLLLGEEEAKLGVLAAMVMGENILLVGPVGGGKTTLLTDSYRLIGGLNSQDVARLPIESDLRPERLIGGNVESTKETFANGDTFTETSRVGINALIKDSTKIIVANEINRINPFALNAALEALESGVMDTTAGTISLKGLEYVISTMNPNERRNGTFPMMTAVASRHSLGSILGVEKDMTKRREYAEKIQDGWVPQPAEMNSVIELHDLHELRAEVPRVPIPDDLKPKALDLTIRTVDTLKQVPKPPIVEADGRITKQIAKTAKTLAHLGAQKSVAEKDLLQAVRYVVTARLGALSVNASEEVENVFNAITG